MVYEIYNRTCDVELVRKALPALLKEHAFWNSGTLLISYFFFLFLSFVIWAFVNITVLVVEIHKVTIQDAQGFNHNLSRYYAIWNKPRPESSTIVRSCLWLSTLELFDFVPFKLYWTNLRFAMRLLIFSNRIRNLPPSSLEILRNNNFTVMWLQLLNPDGILVQDGWGNVAH
jgi:hypothetical protein